MILSDHDITDRVKNKQLVIKPFRPSCVQPASYDVHLSPEFRVFASHQTAVIDVKKKESLTELVKIKKGSQFILHPSEFVLGSTEEWFEIPNDLAAKLEGKSSLGRVGLIIHATAGFIDPGFKGHITFEMSNINQVPIIIYPGMKFGQICFFKLSRPAKHPYGPTGHKYQYQKGPTESRVWQDFAKTRHTLPSPQNLLK